MKEFLVANTSAVPGWHVYRRLENQLGVPETHIAVEYDPLKVPVRIPKSTVKVQSGSVIKAERAERMLNAIDRQHGEAMAAAVQLRRTATALLVGQYE